MNLNAGKTECVIFHTGRSNYELPGEVMLDDICVSISSSTKFLGVHVDCGIKWKVHIDSLEKRLNSSIYSLNVLKKTVDISTLKVVYFANIQSIFSYGIVCSGNSSHSNSLFVKQKIALRTMLGMKFRQTCRGVFRANNILTLTGLYIYYSLKFLIQHPEFFEEFKNNNPRTRQVDKYMYPIHSLALTQNNATYMCIKLFNSLPVQFYSLGCEIFFVKKLFQFVMRCEPYTVNEFFEYCKVNKHLVL